MNAGENTLDTMVARLLIQSLTREGKLDVDKYLDDYITFMTTEGSHNDTYAGTAHRMFFANYVNGKPKRSCADNDGHNTDSIDGLVNVGPTVLSGIFSSETEQNAAIDEMINALRNSRRLVQVALKHRDIILDLINGDKSSEYQFELFHSHYHDTLGESIEDTVIKHGKRLGINVEMASRGTSDPMTACYIDDAFYAMLIFAYRYGNEPEKCLLKSVNAGGENVNRSAVLGFLLGLAHGEDAWSDRLKNGLVQSGSYRDEIIAFANVFCSPLSNSVKLEL